MTPLLRVTPAYYIIATDQLWFEGVYKPDRNFPEGLLYQAVSNTQRSSLWPDFVRKDVTPDRSLTSLEVYQGLKATFLPSSILKCCFSVMCVCVFFF